MAIEKNSFVEFHYALVEQGEVQEGTRSDDPLTYVHGYAMVVPGLEQAMAGREAGDHFQVEVPPELAYGERDESLIEIVPREAFEGMPGLKKGLLVQLQDEEGEPMLGTVVDLDTREVKVDVNHPYAGKTLHFDVEVISVRAATGEEIADAEASQA